MPTRKACVLVVDDDPAITALLQTALEDAGYEVLIAIDGAALPLARVRQPSIILLDLLMPGMGGEEVCRHLREDPLTAPIPVVAMSAGRNLDIIADQKGFDDRLAKPFNLRALYATVERWTEPAPVS